MALESLQLRGLALAGALTLLSACTLEPRYRAPALPVPDQWPIPATVGTTAGAATTSDATAPAPGPPDATVATAMAREASDIGWREFFTDARLQQLIALALA